jgi:hypothetical protein
LAWAVKDRAVKLLFAKIDLLPEEFPRPAPITRKTKNLGNGFSLGYRRVSASLNDAIDFYLSYRDGKLFDFDENEVLNKLRTLDDCRPKDVLEALPFPQLKTPLLHSPDVPPYLAGWQADSSIHECLAADPYSLAAIFGNRERQRKVADWLKDFLFFDLCDYPEYWGGAVLVAPNPLFSSMVYFPKENPGDKNVESVVFRLRPKKGKYLVGLEVICMEKESGHVITLPYREPGLSFDFGHFLGDIAIIVKCPERGVLSREDYTSWPRSIHVNMHVGGGGYEIDVTDEATNKTEKITIPRATTLPSIVGDPQRLSPSKREAFRREQRQEGEKLGQRWFDGEEGREEAKNLVRSLLQGARTATLIVDPYFGVYELGHYGLANGDWNVKVRILTSAEFLRKKRTRVDKRNTSKFFGFIKKTWEGIKGLFAQRKIKDEGDALWDFQEFLVEKLDRQKRANLPVDIRVMQGESPPVHDRFIAVDDRVWLLGSSLNEFGKRGTMLIRLPYPEMAQENLEKFWSSAMPLEAWIAERRAKRGSGVQ